MHERKIPCGLCEMNDIIVKLCIIFVLFGSIFVINTKYYMEMRESIWCSIFSVVNREIALQPNQWYIAYIRYGRVIIISVCCCFSVLIAKNKIILLILCTFCMNMVYGEREPFQRLLNTCNLAIC